MERMSFYFLCLVPAIIYGTHTCYDDLGCYPTIVPGLPPSSLENINASFRLYTTPTQEYQIITKDNVLTTNFNSSLKTVIIAHGYTQSPDAIQNQVMKDLLLEMEPMNVILVDAEDAFSGSLRAFSDALVVGGLLEQLIRSLRNNTGVGYADMHIIGTSLGAQLAAQAGKRAREHGELVGRITGLDPAGPFFNLRDPESRLDPSDAAFVDVIHTNAGELGFAHDCGTVDYYPNGGKTQPGCSLIDDGILCSHAMSVRLFIESMISSCNFTGFPCSSGILFEKGFCNSCSPGGCAVMGINLEAQRNNTGRFYLTTRGRHESPRCIENTPV